MDDLLQKLRAAKPEARNQRDRRRAARLKDRHQQRVASGQKIPELGINVEDEEGGGDENGGGGPGAKARGMLSPNSETGDSETSASGTITGATAGNSSDADVADRAAALLEDMQGGGGISNPKIRKSAADNERRSRRMRRNQTSSNKTEDAPQGQEPIAEEGGDGDEAMLDRGPDTPITVVHPPSPERKGSRELPTPPPEER